MTHYLVAFLCGCLWTMFLVLEKFFIAQRSPFAAALNTFMISVLWINLFKHYSHQEDQVEVLCYALGCACSTFTVLCALNRLRPRP